MFNTLFFLSFFFFFAFIFHCVEETAQEVKRKKKSPVVWGRSCLLVCFPAGGSPTCGRMRTPHLTHTHTPIMTSNWSHSSQCAVQCSAWSDCSSYLTMETGWFSLTLFTNVNHEEFFLLVWRQNHQLLFAFQGGFEMISCIYVKFKVWIQLTMRCFSVLTMENSCYCREAAGLHYVCQRLSGKVTYIKLKVLNFNTSEWVWIKNNKHAFT